MSTTPQVLLDVLRRTRRFELHASHYRDLGATGDRASAAVAAAWSAAREWDTTADVDRVLSPDALYFSRGDPNLTNYLWTGEGVVLIDWENSGLNDPVLEFADFAEHASSRALTDGFLAAFADASGLRPADGDRVVNARRLMACFWLVLIASRHGAGLPTTVSLDEQAQRTLDVLGSR